MSKKSRTRPIGTESLSSNHAGDEDIRDKYELGPILGSGSFGQVREATLKGEASEVRAVKMIERDNDDGEWSNQAIFVREVGLLQGIKHENVIRYYDFYEDLHFLYVVMELCRGGEVFAKIVELKRFGEKDAAALGKQMLRAIEYIHSMKIAHRDVKAENFMLSEPTITSQVKMIDFGMACKFEKGQVLTELCGSPHYLAPELIGQKYDHRADVWAFGVLLYLIQYGQYPYDSKRPRDIMVKILTEPIRWHGKVKLSKDCLNFLKRILEHDPKKRMTPAQALAHPWMKLAEPNAEGVEGEELPVEVLRSAHKKVTTTRKVVDPKVDEARNQKLKQIDEDFIRGIRQGKRLGETPREEYMTKPEYVRRANKISTAPSRDRKSSRRRSSVHDVLGMFAGGRSNSTESDTEARDSGTAAAARARVPRSRALSASGAPSRPRRLSYIGALSGLEEKDLASLYEEKSKQPTSIVPNPGPPTIDDAEVVS